MDYTSPIRPHASALASNSTLVSIKTERGVQQQFIQIMPDRRMAVVMLFAGGYGALGLKGPSVTKWRRGNFLVRSRYRFADHGFVVAVMDAPSDHQEGMERYSA